MLNVLSISSVFKLNILPLNLKSSLFGWTFCHQNFWFLLPRIFQRHLCFCISCSPWTGFSDATGGTGGIKKECKLGCQIINILCHFLCMVFDVLSMKYCPACWLGESPFLAIPLSGCPSSHLPLDVAGGPCWGHQGIAMGALFVPAGLSWAEVSHLSLYPVYELGLELLDLYL